MTRTNETPGVDAYFEALQKIFQLQSEILTGVLPHHGERGRNDEERFRDFLSKVLPKKYSIGTGFLICSEPSVPMSSQTDVVIFDEIQNSPLHRELSAFVYPDEMVYGTVEVKGTLRSDDLKKVLEDIQKTRALASHRWYVRYKSVPKAPDKQEQLVAASEEFQITQPPSRSFVFAYSQKGWSSIESLVKSLQDALAETPAHIHGLAVLSENWFLAQEAYSSTGRQFYAYQDNALLRFVRGMLHSISSMPMHQASVDRYLKSKLQD